MIGNSIEGIDISGNKVCGCIIDKVLMPQMMQVKQGLQNIPAGFLALTVYLVLLDDGKSLACVPPNQITGLQLPLNDPD